MTCPHCGALFREGLAADVGQKPGRIDLSDFEGETFRCRSCGFETDIAHVGAVDMWGNHLKGKEREEI